MIKFLTGLSALYLMVIVVLLVYGIHYYRQFAKGHFHRDRFPWVFALISAACIGFLWLNMHAPLSAETFSNLDHQFIRHDGYLVTKKIELGKTDTSIRESNSYNRFIFSKKGHDVVLSSSYSEDPIYREGENGYQILSFNRPAEGHEISFSLAKEKIALRVTGDDRFELMLGDLVVSRSSAIKKGTTAWNIFREDDNFINSPWFNNERLAGCLRNIYLLRDDVSKRSAGELKFFISGRLFQYATQFKYDNALHTTADLQFSVPLPPDTRIAWGVGFLDNNRNQFKVENGGADSFKLLSRYPVSYPLTESERKNWSPHPVTKFLISDPRDMKTMPSVFREGFLFTGINNEPANSFAPLLLSFQLGPRNDSLLLRAKPLLSGVAGREVTDKLILPARNSEFSWLLSVQNTFDWKFASSTLAPLAWQSLIFGSLLFFFLVIFCSSMVTRSQQPNWVVQLLSCIVMVLLTTRYLLYWRYKSFPPYDGMDLPSQQQLESFSNFGIIVFAAVALACILGFPAIRYAYRWITRTFRRYSGRSASPSRHISDLKAVAFMPVFLNLKNKFRQKHWFFISWCVLLAFEGAVAALNRFDPGVCRRLAIGSVLVYFFYLYWSYRHSPLVATEKENWWNIRSGSTLQLVISNPVKVLLSFTQLILFVFVDIGFAIVFLNFLLFNEAFLCTNYSIAGLSAGSRKRAGVFGFTAAVYMLAFFLNLLFAPFIFSSLLNMPPFMYVIGYGILAIVLTTLVLRLLAQLPARKRGLVAAGTLAGIFLLAFYFFPKERILQKAAMTKFRIDVLTVPVEQAIANAYEEGKTYEPVIRAAQNQWFINTFVHEDNNPMIRSAGFHLLPHAPQNKGARYNAQATDLVTSRFMLAEHGSWSILLYAILLILPSILLSNFYKLYPDFTNRTNNSYPAIATGFSLFNYLLITALLVILAATGRYIFFGQDLPFGSILSKQSILFPGILIIAIVLLFKTIRQQQHANNSKALPGFLVFSLLLVLLLFIKPSFNKNKEFGVAGLANEMDEYVQAHLQPVMDHFDTAKSTRKLPLTKKDQLFSDSLRQMLSAGLLQGDNRFFTTEINTYARSGFTRHVDARRLLYLDIQSGSPRLAVNESYFRVDPPPHLQQLWEGNVFGDSSVYNISSWDAGSGSVHTHRMDARLEEPGVLLANKFQVFFTAAKNATGWRELFLANRTNQPQEISFDDGVVVPLPPRDSVKLNNPTRIAIREEGVKTTWYVTIEPDAFMKNFFVNGSRYYVYPMDSRFNWARNLAEGISSDYATDSSIKKDAFISLDFELMDTLSSRISMMLKSDTAYKQGAEYGICIADGNGRIIALSDAIKGLSRPDPNDKTAFQKVISGDNGVVSQSLLRKQIGNVNLLRLNPGPGSTFKPIVFSAIASQLDWDWDSFAAEGFLDKQTYFGGERVAEYDFEKNNGRINNIVDYLKYSDNYYHSNVLLLGSYPKQDPAVLLAKFSQQSPGTGLHWPYFTYTGKQYWLNGFENWPGYSNHKADFGLDSSFTSVGLFNNYGVPVHDAGKSFERFTSSYDSTLLLGAGNRSGFLLPEYGIFDQRGELVNHNIPYDLFTSCFRGHVKGSSQVMVPPTKMVEGYGRLVSQNSGYSLTLNPYAVVPEFSSFQLDNSIPYIRYLSLIRESVFKGMQEALFTGTAARLGSMLKNGEPYYYYAKTGTTGDDQVKTKSKLLALVISSRDITHQDHNFRNNGFYTIYFTSQNGPAKQNEEFQADIIRLIERSPAFASYMRGTKREKGQ